MRRLKRVNRQRILSTTIPSMAKKPDPSDTPQDRRAFFRRSLSEILRPASAYIESRLPKLASIPSRPLRPPGALPEPKFLDACYRCGSCADHCPADAIALIQSDDPTLKGTPHIDPARRACVMCDDLTCMKVCPSGALTLLPRHEIRVGLAVWDEGDCLRTIAPKASAKNDADPENCQICIDTCPVGDSAIRLTEGRIEVIDPRPIGKGCTGCGVCQEQCPTRPERAIRVRPYPLSSNRA